MNIYEKIGKMDERKLRQVAERMAELLVAESNLLDRWAAETLMGSWSTHQVGAMETRAAQIRNSLKGIGLEG